MTHTELTKIAQDLEAALARIDAAEAAYIQAPWTFDREGIDARCTAAREMGRAIGTMRYHIQELAIRARAMEETSESAVHPVIAGVLDSCRRTGYGSAMLPNGRAAQ